MRDAVRPRRSVLGVKLTGLLLGVVVLGGALLVAFARAQADDRADCVSEATPPDPTISACTRFIDSARSPSEIALGYYNRAVGWRRKNDLDKAIADLDEAIRTNPRYARAFNLRGFTWRAKGDNDRALADYDEAIRIDQRFVTALINRGNVRLDKRDVEGAFSDYAEAVRLEPNNAIARGNLGLAWVRKGDPDRAIAELDEATRLAPNNARNFANRGVAWADRKDLDRAIADFSEAVRLDPTYAYAFNQRAIAWRKKKDFARALADHDRAVKADPKFADAWFDRAYTKREKGDVDGAFADYTEAIRLNPRYVAAYNNRAVIWRTKRDFDRAIADYTKVLELDPAYAAALTGRGLAYEAKGERERARSNFAAALSLPARHDNSQWAHDTARTRLAVIGTPGREPPSPPAAQTAPKAAPGAAPPPAPKTAAGSAPVISGAPGGDRLALVIGNGAYVHAAALPNPPNDARAIGKALRGIGFTTLEAIDLDRAAMDRTVLDFLRRAATARVALLFYAGHAVQIDGRNYIVPVDAKEVSRATASFELLDVDRILSGLDDEARANIVILDACRDNPLESRVASARSGARGAGLAGYSNVASGMLIAFATAPGKTALDGTGANSPFTTALLKHLATPGIEVNQMLTRVRIDVVAATDRAQVPWVNSSLLGDIYLTGK